MDIIGVRKNLIFSVTYIIIPALICAYIYLFYRTSDTVVFQLLSSVFNEEWLMNIKQHSHFSTLPSWLIYNFPGAAWVFIFANLSLLFIDHHQVNYHKLILGFLFLISISIEALQYFKITDGVFDVLDILSYATAILGAQMVMRYKTVRGLLHPIISRTKSPVYVLGLTLGCFTAGIYLADVLVS